MGPARHKACRLVGASYMGYPALPALVTGMSAFILYSISALSLRRSATLHAYQVALFWIAFALICASTVLGPMADGTLCTGLRIFVAASLLLLPAIHAVWALSIWVQHRYDHPGNLKTFGTLLWALWLIPYFTALFFGFVGSRLGDIPSFALSTVAVLALMLCLRDSERTHQNA